MFPTLNERLREKRNKLIIIQIRFNRYSRQEIKLSRDRVKDQPINENHTTV